jgi:hypothetical protein
MVWFDTFNDSQEGREISAVYENYGDFYDWEYGKVQSGDHPGLGNLFYISTPIHLLRIAMNLSRFAELKAVDLIELRALGWTTGLTTIVIKLNDLRDSCLRYQKEEQGKGVTRCFASDLVERANIVASHDFRERFCKEWPAMVSQYPFIRAQES